MPKQSESPRHLLFLDDRVGDKRRRKIDPSGNAASQPMKEEPADARAVLPQFGTGHTHQCNEEREHRSRLRSARREQAAPEVTQSNHQLAADLLSMKSKIQNLERSQGRYKTQLQMKAEQVKDMKVELEEARTQLGLMEEKMDEMVEEARILARELQRYRAWWVTEYYSLRALLGMIPNKADVEAIASSAEDRFKIHSTSASRS
ncbi:hypothetical protein NMY22_g15882 [Coprinellus aureogranulatus]|nr:hypothetical protein NMY22_g15882 [Coprinellus aureogranulatus]